MESFGPYLLVERLGAGGMGEVWLARTRLKGAERLCAIKLLLPDVTKDREAVGRFVDEVRVSVRLQHKNIASVLDVGQVGERHYLAMDFIDGLDLRTILHRAIAERAPLPPPIALAIVDDVLAGLAAAHAAVDATTGASLGVVHRDVSPHNVLVGVDGVARVIDFGLALSTLKRERTEPDVVLGKMAYMAPEQAQGSPVSDRVDVFAAAVVLYELLTAQRFYGSLERTQLIRVAQGGFVPHALGACGPCASALLRAWQPAEARPSAAAWAGALREAAPRATAAEVSTWLHKRWPDAMARAASRRAALAQPLADQTETQTKTQAPRSGAHTSLLDDATARAPRPYEAGGTAVIYTAPGVWGLARVTAPGVVHVVLRGHGDEAAGAWQRRMVDDELARVAGPVRFFSDVDELATHDAIFRQQMTEWQARVRGRVTQVVLFRSQLVVLAISIANKLSGGGTEVTSSRARFDAELAAATAAARDLAR